MTCSSVEVGGHIVLLRTVEAPRGVASPDDADVSGVGEEAAVVQEPADLGLEDAVQLLCLAALHHLVVVEVHHLHGAAMVRCLQVTLDRGAEEESPS